MSSTGSALSGINNRSILDEVVEKSLRRAALMGRSQRQPPQKRCRHVRRATAAPVYCPRLGRFTGHPSHGRALLRRSIPVRPPRSRISSAVSQASVHDCDRDSQYAAGSSRIRLHGVFLRRKLIEFGGTRSIFTKPTEKPQTEDYITGRFG